MIDQLSVFLENKAGRLSGLTRVISDGGINMHSLSIADTSEFGIIRIICDAPQKAADILAEKGYNAASTKVLAVEVPHRTGGLASLLDMVDSTRANVEYAYCFTDPRQEAVFVLKSSDAEALEPKMAESGYTVLQPEDLYQPDEV